MIYQLSTTQFATLLFATILTIILSIYAVNYCLLAIISLRVRKRVLKAPPLHNWPKISIHLPLYDEKNVVARLLESCMNLNYPKNKLEIFVIDDSNDGTTEIVRTYRKKNPGLFKIIHRNARDGYKAGALELALKKSSGDFIAIFDADYMPPKDFLRRMVPFFHTNDRIAFVQARCSHLNKNLSWITKGISLGMDGYGLIDQRARHSADLLAHFSGTGGVFRRKAIMDVGGWHSDTLVEDLDLSIRLQLNGWKYIYLPNIICPGEVPSKPKMFMKQQYRWAKGFTQCFLKYWTSVIRCKNLSIFQKFEALMQLSTYFVYPLSLVGLLCSSILFLVFPINFFFYDYWKSIFAPIISLSSLVIYFSPFFFYGTTISELNRWNKKESTNLTNILYLLIIGSATIITNTKGILEALFHKNSPFDRTFKFGFIDVDTKYNTNKS